MESPRQQTEARAADYLQRRDSGSWNQADQADLETWLAESTAHRIAFLRTEAAWEEMGRLKALGAGHARGTVPTPEQLDTAQFNIYKTSGDPNGIGPSTSDRPPASDTSAVANSSNSSDRARRTPFAVAASILILTGAGVLVDRLWPTGEPYTTPIGGVATIPLEDGSHVILNTQSKIRVLLSDTERHIELSRGEAFFEVAHDTHRPFVVEAGGEHIIAVGTKFSVRRDGEDVRVVVTEGKVRVKAANSSGSASLPTDPETTSADLIHNGALLSAGGVARARGNNILVQNRPVSEAEEALSWRSGYLVFEDTPLADAVNEFNRYSARRIVILGPALGAMKLTGKFGVTNNETFVNLLEQTYHIRAERNRDQIVLTDSPP